MPPLHRILALLLLAHLPAFPEGNPVAAPARIRVATWNLEWLNARVGAGEVPRRATDYAALAREADRLDADIVALQEVDGAAAARRVFDPDRYAFHFTGDSGNLQRTGFAVRRTLPFTTRPDLVSLALGGTRRGAEIEVRLGGRPVRLLSIHLKSGCWDGPLSGSSAACVTLAAQLPVLEAWVDARKRERIGFLVLGDFNRRFLPRDPFWTDLDDGEPPGEGLRDAAGLRTSRCPDGDPRLFIDHIVAGGPATRWLVGGSFLELPPDADSLRRGAVLSDHCPLAVLLDPGLPAPPPAEGPPPVVTSDQAAALTGRIATVCGRVASARFLAHSARQPTFLNLDRPYPDHPFTILIWGKDREAFGAPEVSLPGRRVCVTGLIERYKGRPEIVATFPEQLRIEP